MERKCFIRPSIEVYGDAPQCSVVKAQLQSWVLWYSDYSRRRPRRARRVLRKLSFINYIPEVYTPDGRKALGLYYPSSMSVYIDSTRTEATKKCILWHEVMHHMDYAQPNGGKIDYEHKDPVWKALSVACNK
jgi:hypothetical protein